MRTISGIICFLICTLNLWGQTAQHRGGQVPGSVLVEQVTSASAPFAPDGFWVMDTVQAQFQDLIVVNIHTGDSMALPSGDSCISGLGASFTPGFWVDRTPFPGSGLTVVRQDLFQATQVRDLDSVAGSLEILNFQYDDNTRQLSATVFSEFSDSVIGDLRFNLYIVEDSVRGSGPGYDQANYYDTVPGHPYAGLGDPAPGFIHRNVLRAMLGGAWGRDQVLPDTIVPGDFFQTQFQTTLSQQWDDEHISLVGILQAYSPDSSGRRVINARKVSLSCDRAPEADFSGSHAGQLVTFTNSSQYGGQLWAWDFGDGNTSNLQNPNHLYASPGSYSVCLIATNACGRDTICKQVQVSCTQPVADFGWQLSGANLTLLDSSGAFPVRWYWDFGDGSTSQASSPVHTYASPGTYSVCLIVENFCGADTLCRQVSISCIPPDAGFSVQTGGLTASFLPNTTSGAISWFWYFGEGGTSNSASPGYVYSNPGTYLVCLTITDSCGATTHCQQITVGCPIPEADFSYLNVSLIYEFTDLSVNIPNSWRWHFGDDTSSALRNPVHTYSQPGTYEVCLISGNACGSDTICKTVTSLATELPEPEEIGIRLYPNPVRDRLHLEGPQLNSGGRISICDLTGRVILSMNFPAGNEHLELDCTSLPTGCYWVRVTTGQQVQFHQLLIRD